MSAAGSAASRSRASPCPVDADGTILATLKKWDKSAGAAVTLSAALDLEALVAKQVTDFTLLSTLTDDQRTLDVGDTLYVEIVNNSAAIDTQPSGSFIPSSRPPVVSSIILPFGGGAPTSGALVTVRGEPQALAGSRARAAHGGRALVPQVRAPKPHWACVSAGCRTTSVDG
jgi:hypothetical protein